ncbi:hypothetical protein CVT24_007411 [Panaeolus cyanescens]|uniref:lytic cellulose monooxygenase (C4-dehydrogenating) n=1 Tax=Panaeolus cyanescens TaxID=181874 RepID=A0A409YKX7_9AGAR|nr:hypothetical protein CVT24_007411 [Panaeolus cyanescens]
MKSTTALLALLSAASTVSAHGILAKVSVDGKTYNVKNKDTPIRPVANQNPNYGAENRALTCGPSSRPGNTVADVTPGSVMSFDWEGSNGGNWPHNTGPMLTYMANCGDKSCNDVNPATLQWYKIGQEGRDDRGRWAQANLMSGATAKATIPQGLAPGNYIVRHEIIALHLATSRRGAEFYPGCVAVRVVGNGNGRLSGDTARFPGTYTDDDKGIFIPSLYNIRQKYPFPGPAIATVVNGGDNTPPPAPPAPAPASSSSAAPAPSSSSAAPAPPASSTVKSTPSSTSVKPPQSTPKSNTGKCGNKKRRSAELKKRAATPADSSVEHEEVILKPRAHSRVMRRLFAKAGSH